MKSIYKIEILSRDVPVLSSGPMMILKYLLILGNLAMLRIAYWYQGKREEARKNTEMGLGMIGQISPSTATLFDCYASLAEISLAMREEAIRSAFEVETKELISNALQACQALENYPRYFFIGQRHILLYQGINDWLQRQQWRAKRAWHKSLEHADKMDMLYEKAFAYYEIGRFLPLDDTQQKGHLAQAVYLFTRLDANYNVVRAQEALNHE